jgi:ribosomal protein S18 acetylase RimI-like enzyme
MPLHRAAVMSVEPERLLAFVGQDPHWHRHVVDLGYRLCSPSAQMPDNSCVWSAADGDVVGFAIIQREFWTIDYGVMKSAHPRMFGEILAWADQRMEAIAGEEREKYPDGLMSFFDCFEDDQVHPAQLELAGYQKFASWTQVHRRQALESDLPLPALPDDLVLRPVAGAAEPGGCAALQRLAFDSANMTTEWRLRIQGMPNYVPDLDLVIARPGGELVAFCLGWQMGDQGQIEPLGVHPDLQGRGLGRAILRACLRRMRQRGIRTVHIEHNGEDDPAAQLYIAEGFGHPRKVGKYMRRWHPIA